MTVLRLLLAILLLTAPSAVVAQGLFDTPAKQVRIQLPRDPSLPQNRARATCRYYPGFMVKEVDLGEKGAEQLSILPAPGKARPDCKRDNASGEKVIEGWFGYFKGVKGDYVFFDADD